MASEGLDVCQDTTAFQACKALVEKACPEMTYAQMACLLAKRSCKSQDFAPFDLDREVMDEALGKEADSKEFKDQVLGTHKCICLNTC
eukprot:4113018-Lingulodinium_polyedra.AAC.1